MRLPGPPELAPINPRFLAAMLGSRSMTRSRLRALAAATLLLALAPMTACSGPTFVVTQYGGPERPPETIAILRFHGSDAARLVLVDGERADIALDEDARLHVEVLPGPHSLGVVHAERLQEPLQYVAFVAEAGKVYSVAFHDGVARMHEVDASGELGRDVTAPPEQRERPLPPPPQPPPEAPPAPPPREPAPPVSEPEPDAGAADDAGADDGG